MLLVYRPYSHIYNTLVVLFCSSGHLLKVLLISILTSYEPALSHLLPYILETSFCSLTCHWGLKLRKEEGKVENSSHQGSPLSSHFNINLFFTPRVVFEKKRWCLESSYFSKSDLENVFNPLSLIHVLQC